MNKKIIAILMVLALSSLLLVACSREADSASSVGDNNTASASTPATTATKSSGIAIHLSASSFAQSSITITKGSKLTLVNDTAAFHNIQNGTWVSSAIKTVKENGAPMVKAPINGNNIQAIGPFTIAGTYHLCCVVHPGMNLTVIVQ